MSDNPDRGPSEGSGPTDDNREFDYDEPGSSSTNEDVQDEQERRLAEMEQRLEREASELDSREDDLLNRREEVVQLREEVEALETDIETREERLDEREAAIEEQERDIENRKSELNRKEQTLQNYVGNQIESLEQTLSETVRDSVRSSMQGLDGGGEVDQEQLSTTVRQSVDSAIQQQDFEHDATAFGAVLGSLLAFLGILLVAGGVANGLITYIEPATVTPLFTQDSINYIASSGLVILGFAANLAAAAGKV